MFLSDDAHFVLTITREDVQHKLLKLDAWKSGLGDCHEGDGSGEPGGVSKRSPSVPGQRCKARVIFKSKVEALQVLACLHFKAKQ